jgi:hypothetical protein
MAYRRNINGAEPTERITMATLWEDFEKYADEYYTKQELKSGIKLVVKLCSELLGLGSVVVITAQLLMLASGLFAPLGLAIGSGVMAQLVRQAAYAYINASEEERKQIRTAIRWIKGGFSLGDRLIST